MTDASHAVFKCSYCNVIFTKITLGKWLYYLDADGFRVRYFYSFDYGSLQKNTYNNPFTDEQCDICKLKPMKLVDDRK